MPYNKLIHQDGVLAILGPRTSSLAVAGFSHRARKSGRGAQPDFFRTRYQCDGRFSFPRQSHSRSICARRRRDNAGATRLQKGGDDIR